MTRRVERPRRRRGEGTIFPYRGRWAAAVRVQGPDGVTRRRYFYGATEDDVAEQLDDARGRIRQGLQPVDPKLTVGLHLYDWLDSKRDDVRAATFVSYEGIVRLHLASIHRIPLHRLTPNDVRRLKARLLTEKLAPRSIAYTLTVLRMALRQAVADGLIARNVADNVEPPKVERPKLAIWQPEEVRQFLAAAVDDPMLPVWTLMLGTGLRVGEALGLRWQDVDLDVGLLTVTGSLRPVSPRARAEGTPRLVRLPPKTEASYRTIALPNYVVKALAAIPPNGPTSIERYVFTTRRGTPIDPRNLSRWFEEAIERAGVKRIRVHDMRHTAASLMLAAGMTLDDVKRYLGHTSIVMTSDLYGHLVEGRSREIAHAMNRMLVAR